ncbi:hypothetical protein ACWGBX_04520 [Streptomyces sp. NPDC055037]
MEKGWTISAISRRLNRKAYLNARFTENQGQLSGTRLFQEIHERGYRGSRQVVRKHLAALRAGTAEPVRADIPPLSSNNSTARTRRASANCGRDKGGTEEPDTDDKGRYNTPTTSHQQDHRTHRTYEKISRRAGAQYVRVSGRGRSV